MTPIKNENEVVLTREVAISLLRMDFKEAAENIPQDILDMSEAELFAIRKPTRTDYFLRKNLWKQVERAINEGADSITATAVYSRVCSKQNFDRIFKLHHRLAWMLFPPKEDADKWEETLSFGLDRLRNELMTMEINEKTAGTFLKALGMLMDRVHGPVVQRIDARYATLNMNKPIQGSTPTEAMKQIEELKAKLDQRDVKEIDSGGAL